MSKLHKISPNAVQTIKDGLHSLSTSLLDITALVGDTSSKIVLDGDKIVINDTTKVNGKLGVGVDNVSEGVTFESLGPIKFQGKKFEVGDNAPKIGLYNKGDIVWSDNPKPNGNLGWICIRSGAPGEWKPFGMIGA